MLKNFTMVCVITSIVILSSCASTPKNTPILFQPAAHSCPRSVDTLLADIHLDKPKLKNKLITELKGSTLILTVLETLDLLECIELLKSSLS